MSLSWVRFASSFDNMIISRRLTEWMPSQGGHDGHLANLGDHRHCCAAGLRSLHGEVTPLWPSLLCLGTGVQKKGDNTAVSLSS